MSGVNVLDQGVGGRLLCVSGNGGVCCGRLKATPRGKQWGNHTFQPRELETSVVGFRGPGKCVRVAGGCFRGLINRITRSYFNIAKVIGGFGPIRDVGRVVVGGSSHSGCGRNIIIGDMGNDLIVSLRVSISCNIGVGTVTGDVAGGIHCSIRAIASLGISGIGIFISTVGWEELF